MSVGLWNHLNKLDMWTLDNVLLLGAVNILENEMVIALHRQNLSFILVQHGSRAGKLQNQLALRSSIVGLRKGRL